LVRESTHERSRRFHVDPDGSAVFVRAALPSGTDGINDSTSSLSTSIGHAENEANGFEQSLPTGGFCCKLFATFSRQLIELRFTSSLRPFPVGSQKSAIFKAVQCGVERAFGNLDDATRYLFEPLSDSVTMDRLNSNSLQN